MTLETFFEYAAATKKGDGPVKTMAVPERPEGEEYEPPTEDIPDDEDEDDEDFDDEDEDDEEEE